MSLTGKFYSKFARRNHKLFMLIVELFVVVVFFVILAISTVNFFTTFRLENPVRRRSANVQVKENNLKVSVLIPARNEAQNVAHLLKCLLNSVPKPYEILVLDDRSKDATLQIAQESLQNCGPNYRVIQGKMFTPDLGLSGKNHACQQLAEIASGDVFLFCDADVTVSPSAIDKTLLLLSAHPTCSAVSAIPRQITCNFWHKILMPCVLQLPFGMTLLLKWAWRTNFSSMQLANGQWIAIRKQTYFTLGGHAALGKEVVEDLKLAKLLTIKKLGGVIPALASKDLKVFMYKDSKALLNGFSKNLLTIFGGGKLRFVLLLMFINTLFFAPLWGLAAGENKFAIFSLCSILSCWFLNLLMFSGSKWEAFWGAALFLISLVLFDILALSILAINLFGTVTWKGRNVEKS